MYLLAVRKSKENFKRKLVNQALLCVPLTDLSKSSYVSIAWKPAFSPMFM